MDPSISSNSPVSSTYAQGGESAVPPEEPPAVFIESLNCTLDDVDSFLAEAVSKDRLLCLRVAELLDNMFVSGATVSTITTSEAYQRKICYNAAVYYGIEHSVDGPTLFFRRVATSHPDARLRALLSRVATPTSGPSKVIIARRQPSSSSLASTGSSLPDPARSDTTARDSKSGGESIEEKQERYRQTRERIFGDFVPKPDEPSSLTLAPTPVPTQQESQMQFPEVRAIRGAAPRPRPQPTPYYSTDVRAPGPMGGARPLAAPVAPLLSFGAGSNVWSRSQQPGEQYGQGPPLFRPDAHGPGSSGMAMSGAPRPHNSMGPGHGPGPAPYMSSDFPGYPPGYHPAPYYQGPPHPAPMHMHPQRGQEPRHHGQALPHMQMHRPPMPHDYRMYPQQPW
eukprot:m.20331 g.20331  ORF g.20331 m.20331 type:complete len:395 (+) comp7804_c0_seq1:213-1397(+)